jgi:transcriptional regulator with XRE-family HTH domain
MTSTAFADEASRIRQAGHLSASQIGQAVGAAPSTVREWFSGRSNPTGERAERVAALGEIVERLTPVVRADYIPVWLFKPVEVLGDERPVDLIASGRAREVARAVSELESPGAV